MKLSEMKVDPHRFDATLLDEVEQQFVIDTLQALSAQLTTLAMSKGVIASIQAGGGAVARMIKANMEAGIQPATLAEVRQLRIPGVDDGEG
jgi:hypothetical protein